jgi:DNA-binding CsgD family transcriptional regulator
MCNLLLLKFQTKEVAEKLLISENTAKKYRNTIMKKMGNIEDKKLLTHLEELHREYLLTME